MKTSHATALTALTALTTACAVEAPDDPSVGQHGAALVAPPVAERPPMERALGNAPWRAERPSTKTNPGKKQGLPNPDETDVEGYLDALGSCSSHISADVETFVDPDTGGGTLAFAFDEPCLGDTAEVELQGTDPEVTSHKAWAPLRGWVSLSVFGEVLEVEGQYLFLLEDTDHAALWLELRSPDGALLATIDGQAYWADGAFTALEATVAY